MKKNFALIVLASCLLTACEQSGVSNTLDSRFVASYQKVKALCELTDAISIRGSQCVEKLANLNKGIGRDDLSTKKMIYELTIATYHRMIKAEEGMYNADRTVK